MTSDLVKGYTRTKNENFLIIRDDMRIGVK